MATIRQKKGQKLSREAKPIFTDRNKVSCRRNLLSEEINKNRLRSTCFWICLTGDRSDSDGRATCRLVIPSSRIAYFQLFVLTKTNISTWALVDLFVSTFYRLRMYMCVCMYVCMYLWMYVLSVYLSCMYVCVFVYVSIRLSIGCICLSIYLSIYMSTCLSVGLSVCQSMYSHVSTLGMS